MLKPPELDTEKGRDIWATIIAAAEGDVGTLRSLLDRDPSLSQSGYFYTPPIHFAVREGHLDAVQLLLDAGADPESNAFHGLSLIEMARDRGYEHIASLLEKARENRGRVAHSELHSDHPIHRAAEAGDVQQVRALLDADPSLVNRGDRGGGTPLHRAVIGGSIKMVRLLLDRGADVHAIHGAGLHTTLNRTQPLDLAIWSGPRTVRPSRLRILFRALRHKMRSHGRRPCNDAIARLLLSRGAAYDVTIAAALGDRKRVTAILDEDPTQIRSIRSCGRRPLSAAIEFGHTDIARMLLERGADPCWPEQGSEKGASLHMAASAGDRELVELLLDHGADPNSHIDSAGNAVFAASTPELRKLLMSRGGTVDPYDLVWQDEDDEVMRLVTADPRLADRGCGGVFTAVCTRGKRDLLRRLLDAGIRVPPMVTACRSYLLENPDMLRTLLDSGMNPDLPNWQSQTSLHALCGGRDPRHPGRDHRLESAAILLDAGATLSPKDDEFRSTPLAWAARSNMPDMVEFLLARGAPANFPDDKPWATPLAWATRRGHVNIVEMLRRAGAT